jgi:hypothetical protein
LRFSIEADIFLVDGALVAERNKVDPPHVESLISPLQRIRERRARSSRWADDQLMIDFKSPADLSAAARTGTIRRTY